MKKGPLTAGLLLSRSVDTILEGLDFLLESELLPLELSKPDLIRGRAPHLLGNRLLQHILA